MIAALCVLLGLQLLSTAFFLYNITTDFFLFESFVIPWGLQEILEIVAVLVMLLGVVISSFLIFLLATRISRLDGQIRAVSGDFQDSVERQLEIWSLTPTEKQVAILVMKGFSNSEIAKLRGTTESTVKSQLTSIFRKTQLSSRQQLSTHLIEDILDSIELRT
jgi:DNA-binding CsgD family transcriptional regulator